MGVDGDFWDIGGTASYIVSRNFTVVALQFPDELLQEASEVSRTLQDACAAAGVPVQVTQCGEEPSGSMIVPPTCRIAAYSAMPQAFVMADTTYNSLGVDEVAAQHASAQCVVRLRMQHHRHHMGW